MTRNRNNPGPSNTNAQEEPVLAALVRPRGGRGATDGQSDPVAETLAAVQRELAAKGVVGNNEGEANHHSGSHSHHTEVRQPRVEHVDEHEAEERRLTAFRKHKPPSFKGGYDPTATAKWLQAMEKIFRVIRCPDAMKLVYSVYMLEEEAEDWWTNTVHPLEAEGREITWRLFETLFLDNYFPRKAREQKQNEYNDLKQGSMSIDQYFAKFNELVKYANYGRALPTSAEMTSKFQWVYNVSKTKKPSETQAPNANRATGSNYWKDKKMKGKKMNVNNPFNLFKKPGTQKNFVDRGPLPKCKGCGKEHRGPCATGEVICYKCGRADHYSRQCPQNEVRTMAVQATAVPVSVVPPLMESQTVGRIYTMDCQQSEKAPNLVKGSGLKGLEDLL
ncbi:uncharacterized protein LOC133310302 [Gastrolobium bilobum]|uniref:uncharacterized protein LOC133310302 n=1 Tax=Gastrolobium bilobum TaxID=150636 RepID=UPI002AB00EDB|nr:uncharacterized protein LOC133310302 [Gastrolobium bilobum]